MIVCCFLALATISEVLAGGVESAYLIKPRKVDNAPEALSILRRFIPKKQNFDEKCQRYAVLLKKLAKEPQDQFSIAELGLIKSNLVNNQYKEIDVETLRQLYIDAISKSLQGHVDLSMIELVDCLIRKFRSHDAKARAFLNDQELRDTVDQYKSIMSQPSLFLVEEDSKHPTLTKDQLRPAIRKTLLDLFAGDEARVDSRFTKDEPRLVNIEPSPVAEARAFTRAGAEESQAEAIAAPLGAQNELSQEELEYLTNLINSLRKLYSSLPLQSSLNNRCEAYSRVIDANPGSLSEDLLNQVVRETEQQVSSQKAGLAKFLPQKETRENFLVALNAFAPEQRDATWIDIIDCVSEWEQDDEDVRTFLNSPELSNVINEMMKAVDDNAGHE